MKSNDAINPRFLPFVGELLRCHMEARQGLREFHLDDLLQLLPRALKAARLLEAHLAGDRRVYYNVVHRAYCVEDPNAGYTFHVAEGYNCDCLEMQLGPGMPCGHAMAVEAIHQGLLKYLREEGGEP